MSLRTKLEGAARRARFPGSERYWERRYAAGGNSGAGSYGETASWKAGVVNGWVRDLGVRSIIDWGCGDGNQLSLADYPKYLGIDRSPTAIKRCIEQFADQAQMSFMTFRPGELHDPAGWFKADLALSMEVIFHLTEDEVYQDYMSRLFGSAERYVVICSNDEVGTEKVPTERHRRFSDWIATHARGWSLKERVDPPSNLDLMSQMYLYEARDQVNPS